jgi:Putative Ig domain
MSLTLTQLAADNFQRANVNPLVSPWAATTYPGNQGLQIISELCAGVGWQFYDYDLPNDQYVSATIAALPADENGFMLWARATDGGESTALIPGYKLEVFNNGSDGVWRLDVPGNNFFYNDGLTINPGDVFTLAAVGTTIYVFQNSTLLGSVTDTTYSSGGTAMECDASEVHIANFAIGSASLAALAITTTSPLPNAVLGQPYSETLQATGGTTPYTWSLVSGSLPTGLSLNSAGVISGTPTVGGNFSPTVQVTDSESPTVAVQKVLALDVVAAGGGFHAHFYDNNQPRPSIGGQQRPQKPAPPRPFYNPK